MVRARPVTKPAPIASFLANVSDVRLLPMERVSFAQPMRPAGRKGFPTIRASPSGPCVRLVSRARGAESRAIGKRKVTRASIGSTVIYLNCGESPDGLTIGPELPVGPAEGTQGRIGSARADGRQPLSKPIRLWLACWKSRGCPRCRGPGQLPAVPARGFVCADSFASRQVAASRREHRECHTPRSHGTSSR
jgi:hypothetical protein